MDSLKRKFTAPFESKWVCYGLITAAAIMISLVFLWGTPNEVPMGDSYIHFLYARNLAVHQELSYNPGLQEGLGTSSILWVIILALFYNTGISLVSMSKILGIGLLIVSGVLFFELAKKMFPDQPNRFKNFQFTFLTIMAVFSGSMIWLALSGMETILFLTLGLLCLWLYSRESWVLLGVSLGLLALTRIEGISLTGVVVLTEIIRHRRITVNLVKILVPFLIVLAPWCVYLQLREGMPMATSFIGRQFVISETDERVIAQFPLVFWLQKVNPLIHFITWAYFTLVYISGGASLPGPVIDFGRSVVGTELTLSVAGILVGLMCLPVIFVALRQFFPKLKALTFHDPGKRLQIVVFSWVFVFNLAYALFLPQVGASGRYIPMNHIFFWILLITGGSLIQQKWLKVSTLVLVVLLFGISLNYWKAVFQANVEYLAKVRKPAAEYIDQQIPADAIVGAVDLGSIGFYARQPVLDFFGHINQDFNQFISAGGSYADYLVQEQLCYLMLFGSIEHAGLDYAEEMGLKEDARFRLEVEKSFGVALDEWSLGNGPVRNYMPVVNVYRVEWPDSPVCLHTTSQ